MKISFIEKVTIVSNLIGGTMPSSLFTKRVECYLNSFETSRICLTDNQTVALKIRRLSFQAQLGKFLIFVIELVYLFLMQDFPFFYIPFSGFILFMMTLQVNSTVVLLAVYVHFHYWRRKVSIKDSVVSECCSGYTREANMCNFNGMKRRTWVSEMMMIGKMMKYGTTPNLFIQTTESYISSFRGNHSMKELEKHLVCGIRGLRVFCLISVVCFFSVYSQQIIPVDLIIYSETPRPIFSVFLLFFVFLIWCLITLVVASLVFRWWMQRLSSEKHIQREEASGGH